MILPEDAVWTGRWWLNTWIVGWEGAEGTCEWTEEGGEGGRREGREVRKASAAGFGRVWRVVDKESERATEGSSFLNSEEVPFKNGLVLDWSVWTAIVQRATWWY